MKQRRGRRASLRLRLPNKGYVFPSSSDDDDMEFLNTNTSERSEQKSDEKLKIRSEASLKTTKKTNQKLSRKASLRLRVPNKGYVCPSSSDDNIELYITTSSRPSRQKSREKRKIRLEASLETTNEMNQSLSRRPSLRLRLPTKGYACPSSSEEDLKTYITNTPRRSERKTREEHKVKLEASLETTNINDQRHRKRATMRSPSNGYVSPSNSDEKQELYNTNTPILSEQKSREQRKIDMIMQAFKKMEQESTRSTQYRRKKSKPNLKRALTNTSRAKRVEKRREKRAVNMKRSYIPFNEDVFQASLCRKKEHIRGITPRNVKSDNQLGIKPVRIAIKKSYHSIQTSSTDNSGIKDYVEHVEMSQTEEIKHFSWDFQKDITKLIDSMPSHSIDYDVTLCCLDYEPKKRYICQAHKILLAAASPVLEEVLKLHLSKSRKRPILYLNGMSQINICYILHLIYNGSVQVPNEELKSFLRASETLKLKGVVESSSINNFEIVYDSSRSEIGPTSAVVKDIRANSEDTPNFNANAELNIKQQQCIYRPEINIMTELRYPTSYHFLPLHSARKTKIERNLKAQFLEEEQVLQDIEDIISGVVKNNSPMLNV